MPFPRPISLRLLVAYLLLFSKHERANGPVTAVFKIKRLNTAIALTPQFADAMRCSAQP